jgi:hypothetical protein
MKQYVIEASNSAKDIRCWLVLLGFWRESLLTFFPFSLDFIYDRPFSIDENISGILKLL